MSTFRMMKNKCGLCGHVFESHTLTSTNALGSPDLDLRPPQMQRATMPMWIDKCPNCGYIHAEIEKTGKQHKDFIKSKDYIMCEGAKLSSALARDFYKFALILIREDDKLEAYDAFLHAAWASDDSGDKDGAVFCRNKAISLYDDKLFKKNLNLALRHIDLLRRAGRFTDAINFCKSMTFEDDLMQKVAKFQVELSSMKDTGCYRVADCLGTGNSIASQDEIEQPLSDDREISYWEDEISDLINEIMNGDRLDVDCRGLFFEDKPISDNFNFDEVLDPKFNESIIAKEATIPDESSEDITSNLHGTDATGVSPGSFMGQGHGTGDSSLS